MHKKSLLIAWSTLLMASLLAYQNCGRATFKSTNALEQASQAELLATSLLLIDGGADYTNQKQVQLMMTSPRAQSMKISNLPDCSDGNWETFSNGKVWSLSHTNAVVKVFALFKDLSGNVSDCMGDDITHDDVAPIAHFSSPANVFTNKAALTVAFDTVDNFSGVDTVQCVDPTGVPSSCTTSFSASAKSEGSNRIIVRVTDKAGNVSPDFAYAWTFDQTKPTLSFNSTPAALTGSGQTSFSFLGVDAVSGIDHYLCRRETAAFQTCTPPVAFTGLGEGHYSFDVQAIDRAGNASDILNFKWVVDQTAPTITLTQTPNAVNNSNVAAFGFSGTDNGQAISRFECAVDASAFSACTSLKNLSGLAEGSHNFQVRGYDDAGNVSTPLIYKWSIDLTPPVIKFVSAPPAITNQVPAVFQWQASDAGSGIKTIECRLDGAAYSVCSASGTSFATLADGPHRVDVRVTDGGGNVGTSSSAFTLGRVVPTISVSAGPPPFTNSLNATFAFLGADASGIGGYECRIDTGAFASCPTPYTASGLLEGGHTFFVRAIDKAGNYSVPATYSWAIDLSAPLIRLTSAPGALAQGDHATIAFDVFDPASGVASVTCAMTLPQSKAIDCPSPYNVDLGAINTVGNYQFSITAVDKVGNSATELVNFQVTTKAIICDPFVVGGEAACNGGMIGDIFYLTSAQQNTFKGLGTKTVDYFYANGVQENVLLNLKQLFVSTRDFTAGFPTGSGALIQDNSGATLNEYFAFRLNTVFKLDPLKDLIGYYQFATLSDDGSMVLLQPKGSTALSVLVSNDSDHSTRMGCSSTAVMIDDTSRLPMQVKYYQGPRTEIALTLLWKRVAAANSPLDASCSTTQDFFGARPFGNYTSAEYANLLARGWRVVNTTNLIAPAN